ncbi:hypothetical protein QNN01_18990 [Bradyrhizobium diazoefficiens]|nr:hypothetical protein [Bradyrhizobium diazoefficiens]WLA68558.1 hypothetical protein QNN01_18990 [Bradyrhizobium diazoefficiens]
MYRFSVVEDSFSIAWGFLERSGELREADKTTEFLVRFIEDQIRSGERRPMMVANRAIDAYRAKSLPSALLDKGRVVWIT